MLTKKLIRGMYNNDMESTENNEIIRKATINGLAVVGFVALIAAGVSLAMYSTRFVPTVVNGIGAAVVYLGSTFSSGADISVIPTETNPSTIYFGEASSTPNTNSTSTSTNSNPPVKTSTTAGTKTTNTYQINGTSTPSLSGLPDLIVKITDVGYLSSTSTDSFVASSTVPSGGRAAVKFTIKNIGTNKTGSWRWNVNIPTQSLYNYQSQLQQSLLPGDSIDYVLGFDQANRGVNQPISVNANFDHAVMESDFNNNTDSTKVTIM